MKEYKNRKEFKKDLINLSPIEIYEEVLSGRYLKYFPMYYWNKPEALDNAKIITKYFVENKLIIKEINEIPNKLSIKSIREFKLQGMLTMVFDAKIYDLINNAYPDVFKQWEFRGVTRWNKDNAIDAIKWLVEEKLEIKDLDCKESRDKFLKMYNYNLLGEYNLRGLSTLFNSSPYKLLDHVYPNKFKPWELNMCPVNYWNDNTIKEAVIWLVEEKLKLTCDNYNEMLSIDREAFTEYRLGHLIDNIFNRSVFKALDFAYPNTFKFEDFRCIINNNIRNSLIEYYKEEK